MNSNKMAEGVGKKIVEALKQQADVEIVPVKEDSIDATFSSQESNTVENNYTSKISFEEANNNIASFNFNSANNSIDNIINNASNNIQQQMQDVNFSAMDDMDLPTNVAALKQLITKLPAGVSRQTGAMIIKQTMEALGISMTNVLQEAQQIQEHLNQSVRECQTNVIEYKKQISNLEIQAQKYQRQFVAINDIISLFIQTN